MSERRHLRLVPPLDVASTRRSAQLSFAAYLSAEQRGADTESLKPVGVVLADELERIAHRLRAQGGLG